jgi:hypothetical protein
VKVYPYTEELLAFCLANDYTSPTVIRKKKHFDFFIKYFGPLGLKAKTIVVEEKYISKDYLHDHANYYAFCFENYPKYCRRLHFFDNAFTEAEFETELLRDDNDIDAEISKHYLGFIVVKPIPLNIVGFTLLRTYGRLQSFEHRHFWGIRKYKVHLFGKRLQIDSLAFQEQDHVLAACATTSIWTVLNKVSGEHYHVLRSPSQITKDADQTSTDGSRLFPNKGLSVLQICQAILNSGMVSEVHLGTPHDGVKFKVCNHETIKEIIRAYSGAGVPIIIIAQVPFEGVAKTHSFTASGFMDSDMEIQPAVEGPNFVAQRMQKLYVHDDQWGPFVRLTFSSDGYGVTTPWTNDNGEPAYISALIVPLFPKVRICYQEVRLLVIGIDGLFKSLFPASEEGSLAWDIRLKFSEEVKADVRASDLEQQKKVKFITTSLPKYVWVASVYKGDRHLLDFVFDATSMADAMIGLKVICYLKGFEMFVVQLIDSCYYNAVSFIQHQLAEDYVAFIKKELAE